MFLNREKKYYEILLNAEDDARQIRSFANVVLASNKQGKTLFTKQENPFAFLKETNEPQLVQKLVDAYCTQTPISLEIKANQKIYEISIKKIKKALLLVAKDKTPLYAIHSSLSNQLNFMSDVLSAFIDPVYLTNSKGSLIYVNKAFCTLMNCTFKEALGKSLKFFIQDGTPGFLGIWSDILPFKTSKGVQMLSIYQRPFEILNDMFFCGTLKYPTTFNASDKNYLFEAAPIPIALINALDYRILEVNKAFIKTLNQEYESEYKTNLFDFLSENSKNLLSSKFERLISGLSTTEKIDVNSNPKFGSKTFSLFISFASKEKDSFIIYLVDASERKNLESQFVHAQKMQAIGQLAGGIAHDFNNLLTAIIGFSDLLLSKTNPNDESFVDIMQIKGNANKAASLVGQLLTFSRKQPTKIQVVNFHDAFIDISNLLQRSISPFVTLKTDVKSNLGYVKIDQNQLTQVFLNLAVNAKDAMTSGGELKISATKETLKKAKPFGNNMLQSGEYIKIVVADNGDGISSDDLTRIFEPFFTTKTGSTGSGTGLGLSTVYGIIHSNGGYISVDSEKGIGTTFIIYLPRIEKSAIQKTENNPTRPVFSKSQTENLLLVDDEDGVRLVVSRLLKANGFKVTECANAMQALEILAKNGDFDLLITDMVMPEIDGITLIKRAKLAYPKLKTLLMSGYSENLSQSNSIENKDIEFISKPFELNQLLQKIKEIIEP